MIAAIDIFIFAGGAVSLFALVLAIDGLWTWLARRRRRTPGTKCPGAPVSAADEVKFTGLSRRVMQTQVHFTSVGAPRFRRRGG